MPHRIFQAWLEWLRLQWERPSRSDYYAMQVAAEMRYSMRDRPANTTLEQFKIGWKNSTDESQPEQEQTLQYKKNHRQETMEEATNRSKTIVGACLGIKIPKAQKKVKES